MRGPSRKASLLAALAAGVLAVSTTAHADTVYNTLDTTVDAALETMTLALPGVDMTTTLQLQIDGKSAGDHPGCNLNGAPHLLQLAVASSNVGVATASFVGSDTFNTCGDVLTVNVHPVGIGTTTISVSELSSDTSNDPNLKFSFGEASFTATVADGVITPIETGCDANPAAPAWAAALIKGNNLKPKGNSPNYVSLVAQHMTQGAAFDGFVKNADNQAYANAVWSYMQTTLGLTLPKGPSDVAKPGWECTSLVVPTIAVTTTV